MSRAKIATEREKAWLAVLMAGVAGAVDAIGFLTLVHLFTAHMSGNSVGMGAHLGQGQWAAAFRRAFPIPMYVLGVALGAALTETAIRRGVRSPFSAALVLEAGLLVLFLSFGDPLLRHGSIPAQPAWRFYFLAALPALAMGVQSATLRRVGGRSVRTTYVTGMLTNLAEEAVVYLFWLRDRTRGRTRSRLWKSLRVSPRQVSLTRMVLLGGIWIGYVLGAVLGGYTEQRWALGSLVLPLSGLGFIIVVDLIRPIAPRRGQVETP